MGEFVVCRNVIYRCIFATIWEVRDTRVSECWLRSNLVGKKLGIRTKASGFRYSTQKFIVRAEFLIYSLATLSIIQLVWRVWHSRTCTRVHRRGMIFFDVFFAVVICRCVKWWVVVGKMDITSWFAAARKRSKCSFHSEGWFKFREQCHLLLEPLETQTLSIELGKYFSKVRLCLWKFSCYPFRIGSLIFLD